MKFESGVASLPMEKVSFKPLFCRCDSIDHENSIENQVNANAPFMNVAKASGRKELTVIPAQAGTCCLYSNSRWSGLGWFIQRRLTQVGNRLGMRLVFAGRFDRVEVPRIAKIGDRMVKFVVCACGIGDAVGAAGCVT